MALLLAREVGGEEGPERPAGMLQVTQLCAGGSGARRMSPGFGKTQLWS